MKEEHGASDEVCEAGERPGPAPARPRPRLEHSIYITRNQAAFIFA